MLYQLSYSREECKSSRGIRSVKKEPTSPGQTTANP